jgi:hypothetical protein
MIGKQAVVRMTVSGCNDWNVWTRVTDLFSNDKGSRIPVVAVIAELQFFPRGDGSGGGRSLHHACFLLHQAGRQPGGLFMGAKCDLVAAGPVGVEVQRRDEGLRRMEEVRRRWGLRRRP